MSNKYNRYNSSGRFDGVVPDPALRVGAFGMASATPPNKEIKRVSSIGSGTDANRRLWHRQRSVSSEFHESRYGYGVESSAPRQGFMRRFSVDITAEQVLAPVGAGCFPSRKTKIICAIGPSCSSVEKLGQLLDAGMNVARLNFSHGSHEIHGQSLRNLREAMSSRPGCNCAVLLDTKGPEIRTGMLKNHEPITLEAGQSLEICTDYDIEGDNTRISCSYKDLPSSVGPGSVILCADGEIIMEVVSCAETSVTAKVKNSCVLEERKNMNLPGASIKISGITEKDVYDIKNFGIPNHVDIISGSFVRSAENVKAIKDCLGFAGKHIRVHAKIESLEALRNIDEILKVADGVHVSRGDLGMELEPEQVFLAQKHIIRKANLAGKPVVTSTQMLQSMTETNRPTFAECSDVANAVIDGTDAVMLSAETAKGKFPVEAVETMSRICQEAEGALNYAELYHTTRHKTPKPVELVEAIASSAVETSIDMGSNLIIAFSETGRTAKMIAKYRPRANILAITASQTTARQLEGLSRGVKVKLVSSMIGTDSLIDKAIRNARDHGWINVGDVVVVIHGEYEASAGKTNIVKVIEARGDGYSSPLGQLGSLRLF